jgi:N-acetylglucosaminyldiphosphoundecaprenol N-acetyl-beta-D-mannosaminyltransferase
MAQAIEAIDELVVARCPAMVVTPNADHLIRAHRDGSYAELVGQADLVLVDSQPLVWASRLAGRPLCERVAGSDLFPLLCGHAAKRGYRVFFLGGDPGAAERARDVLQRRYPGLLVAGTHCPPYGFENDGRLRRQALEAVRSARPDILFVGLGSPKQERWIADHRYELGPMVIIGVGISFSFEAGHIKRAPRWMRRFGLEWLHRVGHEPRRLASRYFVRGWGLIPIVLKDIWSERLHRPRPEPGAAGPGTEERLA